jgi:putative IMPACT (imprinted ancient) family translation regulator
VDVTAVGPPVRICERFDFEIPKVEGSRFLATLIPAESDAVVLRAQAELRVANPHCRHVCFAYVGISELEARFSDDGEPAKTAGYPMLRVLLGARVRQSGVLVTRYFGGVKLGTGGLVRAYTAAAREVLLRAVLEPVVPMVLLAFRCRYSAEPALRQQLDRFGLVDFAVDYGADGARFGIRCPEQQEDALRKALGVRTGGEIEDA